MIITDQPENIGIELRNGAKCTCRPRGRPKKSLPASRMASDILKSAIREVKAIAKEYSDGDLEYDVRYIEKFRPRLLKNAGISENAESGQIVYDIPRVEAMVEGDRRVVHRYINSKEKIYFLQHAIESLPDDQLHDIAEDTLLKGIPVTVLANQYHIPARTIWWKKRRALEYIAERYLNPHPGF